MEMWSPEELVAESALSQRLDDKDGQSATAQAAAEAARKIQGHWTTLLAFSKSSMGVGIAMPRGRPEPGQAFPPAHPNERFANQTPEQRVRRAREHLGLKNP